MVGRRKTKSASTPPTKKSAGKAPRKVRKSAESVKDSESNGKVLRKTNENSVSGEDSETGRDSDVSTESQYDEQSESDATNQPKWKRAGKKGKSAVQGEFICKGGENKCDKVIKNAECIRCDVCANWYHPACQGLEKGAFEAISDYDIFWICGQCKEQLLKAKNVKDEISKDVQKMEARIIGKVEEVKNLMVKEIDKKVQDGLKKVEVKIGESSSVLKKVVQEKSVDRSKNVVIHNLPESSSTDSKERQKEDMEAVKKMVSDLCRNEAIVDITQTFRLGKRMSTDNGEMDRRPRLLMVKLAKQEDVELLLKKRFGLKDEGYPNIYINKDLSEEEREQQWKLRMELKKKGRDNYKIFRGQVVPRDQQE